MSQKFKDDQLEALWIKEEMIGKKILIMGALLYMVILDISTEVPAFNYMDDNGFNAKRALPRFAMVIIFCIFGYFTYRKERRNKYTEDEKVYKPHLEVIQERSSDSSRSDSSYIEDDTPKAFNPE
jgi:hypothetical protein